MMQVNHTSIIYMLREKKENYKILIKKRWHKAYTMLVDFKNSYFENDYTNQSNLQIQWNLNQLSMAFSTFLEQKVLQFGNTNDPK